MNFFTIFKDSSKWWKILKISINSYSHGQKVMITIFFWFSENSEFLTHVCQKNHPQSSRGCHNPRFSSIFVYRHKICKIRKISINSDFLAQKCALKKIFFDFQEIQNFSHMYAKRIISKALLVVTINVLAENLSDPKNKYIYKFIYIYINK